MNNVSLNLLQRLTLLTRPTASEKTLMAYIEQNYPKIAFENLERISLGTNLSKATVTRFVRKLGYANFHDFFQSLRGEVAQNFDGGPRERFSATQTRHADTVRETFYRHVGESETNLQRTREQLDMEAFEAVAHLLSDGSRPLYLMGIATSATVLQYFQLLMSYFRGSITLLNGDIGTLAHRLVDVDSKSVLLGVGIDRNSTTLRSVMRHFARMGCETILITNRRSSPFLQYTTYPLFVSAEGTSVFRSRSSVLVLLEALIAATGNLAKATSEPRFKTMQTLSEELQVF